MKWVGYFVGLEEKGGIGMSSLSLIWLVQVNPAATFRNGAFTRVTSHEFIVNTKVSINFMEDLTNPPPRPLLLFPFMVWNV